MFCSFLTCLQNQENDFPGEHAFLIRNCFLPRPHVLSAARVKENYLSLLFIAAPSCQAWRRASTGKFYRVSRGVRPPQGRVGGPWRRWRAVRVEIAQPRSRFGPDPRAKSPPPGKAPPAGLPKSGPQSVSTFSDRKSTRLNS